MPAKKQVILQKMRLMNFNSEWDLLWIPYSPQTCDGQKKRLLLKMLLPACRPYAMTFKYVKVCPSDPLTFNLTQDKATTVYSWKR